MDVNSTLIARISHDDFYQYSVEEEEICQFLKFNGEFLDRQSLAIDIITHIMQAHGKQDLYETLAELARDELGIRVLEPWVRDHVVHALNCFILGILINEYFFKPYHGQNVEPFQWKLAGLFHDIGYPVQIAQGLLDPYANKIQKIKNKFQPTQKRVFFKIIPANFEMLFNGVNSFDLIQRQMKSWDIDIEVRQEYDAKISKGEICHGMISSLGLLSVLDSMYQKYNPERVFTEVKPSIDGQSNIDWNQKYFLEDVVPACSAIFLHNLPISCFSKTKIELTKAPLAFLLRLSDCLQEWERPRKGLESGLQSSLFDIQIPNQGRLVLIANISESRKKEIREDIYGALNAPDILIE